MAVTLGLCTSSPEAHCHQGKRVNHAGRSVISPDPYLRTCEVGVPLYFAKNLEFREKVTAHNVRMMHKLIKNGSYARTRKSMHTIAGPGC